VRPGLHDGDVSDGAPVSEEIYNTIHKVGPEKKLAAK